MKRINNIVVSDTEPSVNSLWINQNTIRWFGKSGWEGLDFTDNTQLWNAINQEIANRQEEDENIRDAALINVLVTLSGASTSNGYNINYDVDKRFMSGNSRAVNANLEISNATSSANGVMSSSDKAKLDSIDTTTLVNTEDGLIPTRYLPSLADTYLPLTGGTMTGNVTINDGINTNLYSFLQNNAVGVARDTTYEDTTFYQWSRISNQGLEISYNSGGYYGDSDSHTMIGNLAGPGFPSGTSYGVYINGYIQDPCIALRTSADGVADLVMNRNGITINGKSSTDLLNAAGGTTSINDIASDCIKYGTNNIPTDAYEISIYEKYSGRNGGFRFTFPTNLGPDQPVQFRVTDSTMASNAKYVVLNPVQGVFMSADLGVTISGKTANDLLNAGGSTTSISDITTQVQAAIVDSAPETLDTLNELAAALGDDPNFATTVTNQIAQKADKTVATDSVNGLMSANDKKLLNSLETVAGKEGAIIFIPTEATFQGTYEWSSPDDSMILTITEGEYIKYDTGTGTFKVSDAPAIDMPTIPIATSTTGGVMSPTDKSRLDTMHQQLTALDVISHVADDQAFTQSDGNLIFNFTCIKPTDAGNTKTIHSVAIPTATTEAAGVMSPTDKTNLDNEVVFNTGHNTVTTLTSVPVDKRLVIANISSAQTLTLASLPADGREINIIVHNTATDAVEVSFTGIGDSYINMSGDTLSVTGSGYAGINIISDGTNGYVRAV